MTKERPLSARLRERLEATEGLSAMDCLVAYAYASFAQGDGTRCRPGHAHMRTATRASEATIRRSTAVLVNAGILVQVGHHGPAHAAEYRVYAPERSLPTDGRVPPHRREVPSQGREGSLPTDGRGPFPQTGQEPVQEPDQEALNAGAREDAELPPEQWGKGWGEQKPENLVPQEPNGPSQHAFYGGGGPSDDRPSTSASATRESASPVVSDVERAVAHYAEVAPLTLRRNLRGPSRARADVEAAVAQHGADAVCAAIDDARRARADGCPPWDWVVQRLAGTVPVGRRPGPRMMRRPEDDPRVRGWGNG